MSTDRIQRRSFLARSVMGLGGIALSGLCATGARAGEGWPGVIGKPQLPVKAKRIIHLCMAGGPSHLETFDFKPALKELHGKPFPESFTKGQQLAQLQNTSSRRAARSWTSSAGASRAGDLQPLPAPRQRSPTSSASSAR